MCSKMTGCLTNILEVANIKKLYMIYPFLGSSLDPVCAEIQTHPIIILFMEYSDEMCGVCGRNGPNSRVNAAIEILSRNI